MTQPSIGLIGCGRWGEKILRDLRILGCEVFVSDPAAASRSRAEELGVSAFPSVQSIPGVDGFVIATPTSVHEKAILEVAGRGTPIYCEKPLTANPVVARRLADTLPDRLFVMDKWRYHPAVEALAAIARDEKLGPVQSLRTARLQWGSDHRDVDGVWILAPHDLSIAIEILGELPALLSATGETEDGEATGLRGFFGPAPSFELDVSTRIPEKRRSIRLQCALGTASWSDSEPGTLFLRRDADAGREDERPLKGAPPLLRELEAFVRHLDGGPPPKSPASDGASVVEALAALRRIAGLDKAA